MKINFGSKFDKQCSDMIEVCLKAMSKVMEYYKNGFDVEIKSDNSPVTDADKQSDLIIKSFLKEKFPTYAFLTEESNDDKSRLNEKYVFIIDPLDGTKDFVAKDDMFAINIALVEEHTPVVGVVGIPAQNKIYFAIKDYGSYLLENDALKRIYASDRTDNLIMSCSVFHSGKTDQEIFDKFQNRILKKHPLGSYKKLKKLFFAFYQLHRQIIFCRSIISSITIAIINIFTIICYFITIKSSEMTTRFFNDNLRSTSIPFFCISA